MKIKDIAEILFLPSLLVIGIISGLSGIMPQWLIEGNLSAILLGLLVFQVGIGLGARNDFSEILRTVSFKTLLLPLFTIIGTLIATGVSFLIINGISFKDCLAVGSGFGYYSMSSMLILQFKSASGVEAATLLATTALLANIIRELIALMCCSFISKSGRGISAISLAGINSMDVFLPYILTDNSRSNLMPLAIIHGIILELSVPVLISMFC